MRHVTKAAAVLFLLAIVAILSSAGTSAAQKKSVAPGLKPGDVWALILLNDQGGIVRSLIVRVTDEPAASCRGGTWNRLAVLDDHPRRDPASTQAAYEVSSGEVTMDLAIGICDAYLPLHGEISDLGIQGTHGTLGLGGGKTLGRFYGTKLPPPPPGSAIK